MKSRTGRTSPRSFQGTLENLSRSCCRNVTLDLENEAPRLGGKIIPGYPGKLQSILQWKTDENVRSFQGTLEKLRVDRATRRYCNSSPQRRRGEKDCAVGTVDIVRAAHVDIVHAVHTLDIAIAIVIVIAKVTNTGLG